MIPKFDDRIRRLHIRSISFPIRQIFNPHPHTLCPLYSCDDAPDDAPFELTELDHLTLADDYARALALADAQAQAPDTYASDDSDNDSLGIDDPDLVLVP